MLSQISGKAHLLPQLKDAAVVIVRLAVTVAEAISSEIAEARAYAVLQAGCSVSLHGAMHLLVRESRRDQVDALWTQQLSRRLASVCTVDDRHISVLFHCVGPHGTIVCGRTVDGLLVLVSAACLFSSFWHGFRQSLEQACGAKSMRPSAQAGFGHVMSSRC